MSKPTRMGVRAITMQQPFASAMVHGQGLFTRRGKPTKFAEGGEWIAIHCGSNSEHLKNKSLMAEVRKHWPDCPSDAELQKGQKSILGVAHFVDGNKSAREAERQCFYLQRYDCTKATAWAADRAAPVPASADGHLPYPKGNLQVWHVTEEGFTNNADIQRLSALIKQGDGKGSKAFTAVKEEITVTEDRKPSASTGSKKTKREAQDVDEDSKKRVKKEQPG